MYLYRKLYLWAQRLNDAPRLPFNSFAVHATSALATIVCNIMEILLCTCESPTTKATTSGGEQCSVARHNHDDTLNAATLMNDPNWATFDCRVLFTNSPSPLSNECPKLLSVHFGASLHHRRLNDATIRWGSTVRVVKPTRFGLLRFGCCAAWP